MSNHHPVGPTSVGDAILQWVDANTDQGIFTTDAALRVCTWNHWLVSATGLPAAAVVGRPVFEVLPSMLERGFDQYYADALRGEVKILSHAFHRFVVLTPVCAQRAAQMPQSGRIGPLCEGSQVIGTITLIDDVSERVESDRQLRNQIGMAETASRVKDEFLATLSHEIRTPLNAVLGWTRILMMARDPDRATVKRAIEVIDRNASAQLTLVSDMLDMARVSAGKVRLEIVDADFAGIVLAAIDVVTPAAEAKGVELITTIAPHVPTVRGDADRLLQVVWNLLSNAVKFTESGGQVRLGVSGDKGSVRLTVTDTGQGIASAFLPQVFERFKQADPSQSRRHGGLGLGLALVRELVELHGGSVSVESPGLGSGTTFSVRLPTQEASARKEAPLPDGIPIRHRGALAGVHILVVEDDPDALEILVRTVTDAGASVSPATCAADGLAYLRGRGQHPRVIVTDISMPGGDGYRFLDDVRHLSPEDGSALPVIAVTASVSPEDRARALQAGFESHVGKPFTPTLLIAAIARAAAREVVR